MTMRKMLALGVVFLGGCSSIPSNCFAAPKELQLDGTSYLACSDFVYRYSPSRGVADSNKKTYEFKFIDEYGQQRDVKEVSSYVIRDAPNATFAMPSFTLGPDIVKYSNGTPFTPGSIVLWGKDGQNGRAKFIEPGEWKPVPCG